MNFCTCLTSFHSFCSIHILTLAYAHAVLGIMNSNIPLLVTDEKFKLNVWTNKVSIYESNGNNNREIGASLQCYCDYTLVFLNFVIFPCYSQVNAILPRLNAILPCFDC